MHAAGSDARLKSLLRERGIQLGRASAARAGSLRSALEAFVDFAAIPVTSGELEPEPLSDGLLYEFGVFDFGDVWGKTLTLSLVRQYGMTGGDLQQVHLEAHFRPAVLAAILRRTRAEPCDSGTGCTYRCAYGGTSDLIGERCTVKAATPAPGRSLQSASMWSFDTGEAGTIAAREAWVSLVEESPPFKYLSAHRDLLLGYQVWQDSAE
jgi:hypothetical protein